MPIIKAQKKQGRMVLKRKATDAVYAVDFRENVQVDKSGNKNNLTTIEFPILFKNKKIVEFANKVKGKEGNLITVSFTFQDKKIDKNLIFELLEKFMNVDDKDNFDINTSVPKEEKDRRLERRKLTHKAFFLAEMMGDNFDPAKLHAKDDLKYYEEFKDLDETEKQKTLKTLQKAAYEFKL